METGSYWDQLRSALGLDEPQVITTLAKTIQVVIVVLLTIWIAHWTSGRIRRATRAGHIDARGGALISRAAAFGVYCLGAAVVVAILGANWTAIAAVLGVATVGISLWLQDVGRGWVNGLYILIERPFRLGDRIRVGDIEGRVEEVGVRLTRLRTGSGARLLVPNSTIFAAVVENLSYGMFDRETVSLSGVTTPLAGIEELIVQAFAGMPQLASSEPVVTVVDTGPDGSRIDVTIEIERASRVSHLVIDRLHELFPEAIITTRIPVAQL